LNQITFLLIPLGNWLVTMKFQNIALTCLAALIGSANAFSAVRPDIISTRVEEALKITASFGIDSKEAQVAWDIVEELNASDNRCVLWLFDVYVC
jgi:hypothetical protein